MAKKAISVRFEPKMWEKLNNLSVKLNKTGLTTRTASEIIRQGTLKEIISLEQQLEDLK